MPYSSWPKKIKILHIVAEKTSENNTVPSFYADELFLTSKIHGLNPKPTYMCFHVLYFPSFPGVNKF